MKVGWFMDDDLITLMILLYRTSWYSLSSNEMICYIWRMEGAFCLLYTLLLEVVYAVTRHQTTATPATSREEAEDEGMLRVVVCIPCWDAGIQQVAGNRLPKSRWLQLADSSYYSIYKYSSLMFSLFLVLYSCFLFKTTWLLNCWFVVYSCISWQQHLAWYRNNL